MRLQKLTVCFIGKDAEIAILKAELLATQTEGPDASVVQALERENAELKAKITALQEKAIKDNNAANARLTLIIQSLSHQPPPSQTVKILPRVFFLQLIFVSLGYQFDFNVLNVIVECYLTYSSGVLVIIYCECFSLSV